MKVLLVGNYLPDNSKSMHRYFEILSQGLQKYDCEVIAIRPESIFLDSKFIPSVVKKWLGYISKYIIFPIRLFTHLKDADILHVCDHANAFYILLADHVPSVITCHDLFLVENLRNKKTIYAASGIKHFINKLAIQGLKQAIAIVCVSDTTLQDVKKIVGKSNNQNLCVIHNMLDPRLEQMQNKNATNILSTISGLSKQFILEIGSGSPRKNREGTFKIFAKIKNAFSGQLVIAGTPPNQQQIDLAKKLEIHDRIIIVPVPNDNLLAALYKNAFCLLFPTFAEGFGLPIIEAQYFGCPTICSNLEPLPEVAGHGAIMHPPEDEESFAASIMSLTDSNIRDSLIKHGLENVERFKEDKIIPQFINLYESILSNKAL